MHDYSFSRRFVLRWLATAALGRRRDAAADGRRELARYEPTPHVIGSEQILERGPFIVVMNHYERPGLRVWWAAWLVSTAVAQRRSEAGIRWLITDRFGGYRLFGVLRVPETLVVRFLRLIAGTYELLVVTRREVGPRAPVLREAYRSLHSRSRPIGVTPEAGNAREGPGLAPAVPESGPAIAWLSRGTAPVLPVGVYEDADGRLTARFGATFTLDRPERGDGAGDAVRATTERVMRAVARLLPPELHGAYDGGAG